MGGRVSTPTWRNRDFGGADSHAAFKNLTHLNNENAKPIFLYITSTEEEMEQKVTTYEDSILVNEKICIAAKFFDCYQVDVTDIDEEHPLREMIKKPKPLTFYTLYKGEIVSNTEEKPSVSTLLSACSRTLKKSHQVSLDKVTKEEVKILDDLDKIAREMEKIGEVRIKKGDKISSTEDKTLRKKEEKLLQRESELKEKETRLLELDGYGRTSKTAARK
jgi:hypothetical protein